MVPLLVALVLGAGYILAAVSYGASLHQPALSSDAPPGGVGAVFVPQQLLDTGQETVGYLLLFPAADLLDTDGTLRTGITVTVEPTVGVGTVVFRAGQAPAPQRLTLPAPGVVEEYPFDSYQVYADVRAVDTGTGTETASRPLPVTASVLFRIPGWRQGEPTSGTDPTAALEVTVQRSGSTMAIALMILLLMVALAVIAALVVHAAMRGRIKLEMSVASWITAMLFALIPLRGFLPGQPPIGSWIDILVFFWVELALMTCVGIVAASMLVRAHRRPVTADAGA